MQKLTTRPKRILILAVLLVVALIDFAALIYMSFFIGLLRTPLQALPPLYWVVLFIPVMVGFVCTMIIASDASRITIVKNTIPQYVGSPTVRSAVGWGFAGVLFLIWAFINNLTKPQLGGYTALLLSAACVAVLAGYALYKLSQILK